MQITGSWWRHYPIQNIILNSEIWWKMQLFGTKTTLFITYQNTILLHCTSGVLYSQKYWRDIELQQCGVTTSNVFWEKWENFWKLTLNSKNWHLFIVNQNYCLEKNMVATGRITAVANMNPSYLLVGANVRKSLKHTHTHNRLTAFCPGLPG